MKYIELTNSSQLAIVDDEDYALVLRHNHKWHEADSGIYTRSKLLNDPTNQFLNAKIALHRLVLNKLIIIQGEDVDHINGNKYDNRKCNLRLCSHLQNLHNAKKWTCKKLTSKYKGVSRHSNNKCWQVFLMFKGKKYYGGVFKNEIEAAIKSDDLNIEHCGIFSSLNFPLYGA